MIDMKLIDPDSANPCIPEEVLVPEIDDFVYFYGSGRQFIDYKGFDFTSACGESFYWIFELVIPDVEFGIFTLDTVKKRIYIEIDEGEQ